MSGKPGTVPWNKGKPLPHTPEWEAKRLAALRKSGLHRRGKPIGGKEKHVAALHNGFAAWAKAHPDEMRALAIRNLPPTRIGPSNPNWRGGVTPLRKRARLACWRRRVLARTGGRCCLCGSTDHVRAHHIVSVAEAPEFAAVDSNGVPLCERCHLKAHDGNYAARKRRTTIGTTRIFILTVPPSFANYKTVGNWGIGTNGNILVLVYDVGDERYNFLLGLHEMVEAFLCKRDGVTTEDVDRYDGVHQEDDDPGLNPGAPYHRQHMVAFSVEILLAQALGVDWIQYNQALDAAWERIPERPSA